MAAGCSEHSSAAWRFYLTLVCSSSYLFLLLCLECASQDESLDRLRSNRPSLYQRQWQVPDDTSFNYERSSIKPKHALRHHRKHRNSQSTSHRHLNHSDHFQTPDSEQLMTGTRHATSDGSNRTPVTHFEYPRHFLSSGSNLNTRNTHLRSRTRSRFINPDEFTEASIEAENNWRKSNAHGSSNKRRKKGNRGNNLSSRSSSLVDKSPIQDDSRHLFRNGGRTRQAGGKRPSGHRKRKPKELPREFGKERTTSSRLKEKRPNIILLMTDDLDVELGSLNYMPRLLRLMGGKGILFPNSYTSTPMCCPSRSSMLTGMYIHNHEIYTNHKNCSGPQWQRTHERRSFAAYLKNAGYKTAYFGKYLNRYNGSHVPPGWQEWAGLVGNSRYYNYTVNRNSQLVKYGNKYPQDYFPHVITTDGSNFLRESQKDGDDSPFLMVLSYPAPHGPEDSAPEHSHKYFNASAHHTASYDYAPNPDKQWMLQYTDRMPDIQLKFTDLLMTKRLQTLQSIDEAIEKIATHVDKLGLWDSTYMFFTSDHGYHLGQFGLAKGKSMPFEFDIKVPLFVRGPGIQEGSILSNIALNIDLAPTFLDIAGLPRPPQMDGRSLLPVLKSSYLEEDQRDLQWRDSFLVESSGRLREEEEFEKKEQRIWQRERALNKQFIEATASSLNGSTDQTGSGQSIIHLYTSKHERFEEVCQRNEFASPCTPMQKWHCVNYGKRWRIKKCRQQNDVWKKHCICQSPHGLGTYRKLDHKEKKKQRIFLKKYLSKSFNSLEPKFIKTFNNVQLPNFYPRHTLHSVRAKTRRKTYGKRHRRSSDSINLEIYSKDVSTTDQLLTLNTFLSEPQTESLTTPAHLENLEAAAFSPPSVELNLDEALSDKNVQAFVNEEELRDLEDQIYDISDELQSLENASSTVDPSPFIQNQTDLTKETNVHHGCQANDGHIDCQEDIYENIYTWMSSKIAIEDHIRRLRQQLALMKNIHRHLQSKRPDSGDSVNLEMFEDYESTEGSGDHLHRGYQTSDDTQDDLDYVFPVAPSSSISQENSDLDAYEKMTISEFPTTTMPSHFEPTDENIFFDEKSSVDLESHKISRSKNIGGRNLRKKVPARSHPRGGLFETTHNLRLFPVPMSSLLNEFSATENEAVEPLCWCDRRIAKRLQLQQERASKREERHQVREQRQNKKRNRRRRKKSRQVPLCDLPTLNCYTHDDDHWRTPPLWTDGSFCFCINAANNTYWCLRTINQTQNFLYCEFITGLITYYDLHIDPYQLRNVAFTLSNERVTELHSKLQKLRVCAGADHCDGFRTDKEKATKDERPGSNIAHQGDRKGYDLRIEESGGNSVLGSGKTHTELVSSISEVPNYKIHFNKRRKFYKFHERERRRKLRKEKRRKKLKRNKFEASMSGLSQLDLEEAFASREHKIRLPRKSRREKIVRKRKRIRERRKRNKLRKTYKD